MRDPQVMGWDNRYERIGRKRAELYYNLEIHVEKGDHIYSVPLDIGERHELDKEVIEGALGRWLTNHDEDLVSWRVAESMTCAVGGVGDVPDITPSPSEMDSDESPYPGPHPSRQHNVSFEELDLDIKEGDAVEWVPAGQSSVYSSREGRVVDIAPGPDEKFCLVVRTESGRKKVRQDWLIDPES